MSSMALVQEDNGGYSNINMEAYATVLATASEDEYGTEMTSSKEDSDSALSCRNLSYQFRQDVFSQLGISTKGCTFISNDGRVTGAFFVYVRGQQLGPFNLPISRQYTPFLTVPIPGGNLVVLVGVSSAGSGRVQIGLRANGASESYVRTGFSQSF
mmetsp:Transcript_2745/g.3092  ORF Transcript_2745/g.3092 Transcript_2745/m.3092 type:complete len:156 (+) Transcript_2745:1-468(+)